MPVVILIILAGAVVGYFIRNCPATKKIGTAIGIVIMLLLFVLGITVGANREVVTKFHLIGVEALLIAFAGTIGSILCGWVVYRYFFDKKNKQQK